MINIAVSNHSTVVSVQEFAQVVSALQVQLDRDVYPVWGITAHLTILAGKQNPTVNQWQLVVLDHSDQADALGYHDVTVHGKPLGKVFAADDKKYGLSWSVTISHELIEMLGDPDINLCAFSSDKGDGSVAQLVAYELCDACEDDSLGYKIGDVLVSDFVLPEWFMTNVTPPSGFFDFGKHVTQPFQLLSGGYIGVYNISTNTGWTQLTHDETTRHKDIKHSRFGKRPLQPHQRKISTSLVDTIQE
jgi:hypothetical protein